MKKLFVLLFGIIVCIGFVACSKKVVSNKANKKGDFNKNQYEIINDENDVFKFIPDEFKEKNKHVEKVDMFDSEISIGYKNEDETYTAYIFSSPIKYKKGSLGFLDIDNRLKKIISGKYFDDGFRYRNNHGYVLSYFPEQLDENNYFLMENDFYDIKFKFTDILAKSEITKNKLSVWNQKNDTVIYKGIDYILNAYATKAGIRTELVFNDKLPDKDIVFEVEASDLEMVDDGSGYFKFIDATKDIDDQLQVVIRPPIIIEIIGLWHLTNAYINLKNKEKFLPNLDIFKFGISSIMKFFMTLKRITYIKY